MPALLQLTLIYYMSMYLQYMNLFFNSDQLKLHGKSKSLSTNPAPEHPVHMCHLQSLKLL